MTTATATTPDELRDQIAEHEQEIAEAKREIGAAQLDGKSTAGPTKRARDAREAIGRCEAALEELARREAQAEEERRTGEASKVRQATYESLDPYLDRIENYTRRRDEFEAAEKALLEHPVDRRFRATKSGWGHTEESDLDTGLLGAIPDIRDARYQQGRKTPAELVNPEDERNARSVAELEKLAFHVLDLETAGDARARYLTQYHLDEGGGLGGEETRRELSRWGFHHQAITADARDQFVSQLCALAAQDAFEFLRDNGADFTADQVLELAEQYGLTEGDVARALDDFWPPALHFVQVYASADNVAVLIERAD